MAEAIDWGAELLGTAGGNTSAGAARVQPATDWGAELLGPGGASTPAVPAGVSPQQAASPSPNAEPDASSWIGRRAQDVLGKRDARYQGIPTIAEALKGEGSMGFGRALRESGAWLTGASDKDMAGVYKGMLGDRFVRDETDANGYPVIVYKGKDGREAKAYVNAPGLDMQDVVRGVEGIAPYVGAGRLVSGAMKASALVPRMVGQALGQGATSVAQDAAGVATGVSRIDPEATVAKAGFAAAGGAAGELAGAGLGYVWRKLVAEPRYFDKVTGKLTAEGEKVAIANGLDPAGLPEQVARDFSRSMANTGDGASAALAASKNEFKIPLTAGEVSGNKHQLLREQQLTGGSYGEAGARRMKAFRDEQDAALKNAARGWLDPNTPGIAGELAPGRAGSTLAKDELGANIRANTQSALDRAKEVETNAWKAVPDDFRANDAALSAIDDVIPRTLAAKKVAVIEEGLTPTAKKMSDMIEKFQAGEMPAASSKYVDKSLAGHVDVMRRRLLAASEEAATDTDRRAARALYDGFNDWIVEAAKLSGDPSIAMKLSAARTISREIHQVFDGQKGTAGARVMSSILKNADSAEGVVNSLFSVSPKSEIKGGAISALDSLKKAYDRHLSPEAAKAAWDDIRLAYWMRIVDRKTGDAGGPQAIASAIKSAINNQGSIAKRLFTPAELAKMNRLATTLDQVARRNPNTSWSGVSVGALMKDVSNSFLSAIGWNTPVGRMAMGVVAKPFVGQYGEGVAAAALNPERIRPRVPPIAGLGGGVAREQR